MSEPLETTLQLLAAAVRKFPDEEPDHAAEQILRYAAYLAVLTFGQDRAEHAVLRAIDDYSKFRGE